MAQQVKIVVKNSLENLFISVKAVGHNTASFSSYITEDDRETEIIRGSGLTTRRWSRYPNKPKNIHEEFLFISITAQPVKKGDSVPFEIQFSQIDANDNRHRCTIVKDGSPLPDDTFRETAEKGQYQSIYDVEVV